MIVHMTFFCSPGAHPMALQSGWTIPQSQCTYLQGTVCILCKLRRSSDGVMRWLLLAPALPCSEHLQLVAAAPSQS